MTTFMQLLAARREQRRLDARAKAAEAAAQLRTCHAMLALQQAAASVYASFGSSALAYVPPDSPTLN